MRACARPRASCSFLGNNLLRSVPAGVLELHCLKKLWLPANAIQDIPKVSAEHAHACTQAGRVGIVLCTRMAWCPTKPGQAATA